MDSGNRQPSWVDCSTELRTRGPDGSELQWSCPGGGAREGSLTSLGGDSFLNVHRWTRVDMGCPLVASAPRHPIPSPSGRYSPLTRNAQLGMPSQCILVTPSCNTCTLQNHMMLGDTEPGTDRPEVPHLDPRGDAPSLPWPLGFECWPGLVGGDSSLQRRKVRGLLGQRPSLAGPDARPEAQGAHCFRASPGLVEPLQVSSASSLLISLVLILLTVKNFVQRARQSTQQFPPLPGASPSRPAAWAWPFCSEHGVLSSRGLRQWRPAGLASRLSFPSLAQHSLAMCLGATPGAAALTPRLTARESCPSPALLCSTCRITEGTEPSVSFPI